MALKNIIRTPYRGDPTDMTDYNRPWYIREDSTDTFTINEMQIYNPYCSTLEGERVLDLGANIGTFARFARAKGAAAVCSVEPDEENFKYLTLNTQDDPAVERVQAAVANDDKGVDFYINSKRGKNTHTTFAYRGRPVVRVPTISLKQLVDDFRPTVIKSDIEGGELFLDWSVLPDNLTQLIMEFHKGPSHRWEDEPIARAAAVIEETTGLKLKKPLHHGPKAFAMMTAFIRKEIV